MKTFNFDSNEKLGLAPCYLMLENNNIRFIDGNEYFFLDKRYKIVNQFYSRELVYKEWTKKL